MHEFKFRPGNYVQDIISKEWMVITDSGRSVIGKILDRSKYPLPDGWQMGPIPTTAEALQRLGGYSFQKGWWNLRVDGGEISIFVGTDRFRIQDNNHAVDIVSPGLKYIHGVQNLYFSLSGKELYFKPSNTVGAARITADAVFELVKSRNPDVSTIIGYDKPVFGYLFVKDDKDFDKGTVTINGFTGPVGRVLISIDLYNNNNPLDKERVIKEEIAATVKLNNHATLVDTQTDYNGDDFARNKISSLLTFHL